MGGAEEMEDGVDMDVEGRHPLLGRQVGDLSGRRAAGGGDREVDPAEPGLRRLRQFVGDRRIGSVAMQHLDIGQVAERRKVLLDFLVAGSAVDDEPNAALRQLDADGSADAARPAGDDGDMVPDVRHVIPVLVVGDALAVCLAVLAALWEGGHARNQPDLSSPLQAGIQ